MPGPASTAEERSLRKRFCPRGPWFDPRRRKLLFRHDNSHQRFDGNPISDGFFQFTQPCQSQLLRTTYYCMKRNVALEIGPMTSQS